ncbi:uncharacterized protein CTRU02_202760 [Colletotrichum truncatum]|uniref:Uncharacterized protein n=1 Tax=Colletotrichum truncatum TaxID=5467 RepID=A0ACC3ZL90_COLTU|nr:uncharacterized protein CTRU02_10685 [Colletotrichum truncatum]KAF6786986.1 hypothetical protein CTRU02_10685 [Colletotrichum truncatum]
MSPTIPSSKYSALRQSEETLSEEGSSTQPLRVRPAESTFRLLVSAFVCCLLSVAVGFSLGRYGYEAAVKEAHGHNQAACIPEPKSPSPAAGLGMATIDEAPFIKDVPLVRKKFEHDSSYNFTAPGSNQKWLDLISFGKPFVAIHEPAKYGLPDYFHKDALQPEGLQPVAWNVFHQLHCLVCFRTTYMRLALNLDGGYEVCTKQHIEHCLESIRQATMCAANMNMERFEFIHYPGHTDFVPKLVGQHETHTCRDWDAIKRNIQKVRAENIPVDKYGKRIGTS